MRTTLLPRGLLAALCACAAPYASAKDTPTNLFPSDGPVGAGWTARQWDDISKPPKLPSTWVVRDGVLYGAGGGSGDAWSGGWLMTEAEYGDFILELEFKFKNGGKTGNGGVALRAPLNGDPAYEGLELQITDPQYELKYFPNASDAQLTGALYLVSRPSKLMYQPGKWNRYRVEMRGPKVKVTLNGSVVQDIDLDKFTIAAQKHGKGQELLETTPGAQRPRRGHIGLQDLSEDGESLLFRNVRVTALD